MFIVINIYDVLNNYVICGLLIKNKDFDKLL